MEKKYTLVTSQSFPESYSQEAIFEEFHFLKNLSKSKILSDFLTKKIPRCFLFVLFFFF